MEDAILRENGRLLALLSRYLNDTPDAVTAAQTQELSDGCGIPFEQAFAALLTAYMTPDESPEDEALLRRRLPLMLHREDPAVYRADPWLTTFTKLAAATEGNIRLETRRYAPMELFVRDDFHLGPDGRLYPQLGWFRQGFDYPALTENGRVWMTVTPNEINTLRPLAQQSRGRVLCCGLGLGYYALHACLNPAVTAVTVAERSDRVIRLFRRSMLPRFPHAEKLRIVEDDAFAYAERHRDYDTVLCDLWHDVSDGIPLYLRMKGLEHPGVRYLYWIEPTMRYYLDTAAVTGD